MKNRKTKGKRQKAKGVNLTQRRRVVMAMGFWGWAFGDGSFNKFRLNSRHKWIYELPNRLYVLETPPHVPIVHSL